MTRSFLAGLVTLAVFTSGCATYKKDIASVRTQQREDIMILKEDMRALEGRIEGLELENRKLTSELASLKGSISSCRNTQTAIQGRLDQQESMIKTVDAARQKDKQDMVNELSGRMAALVKRSAPAPAVSGTGYEHPVEPGQTLSEIAAVYGVSIQDIVQANQIKDPDQLKAGTKLFIPKR